MIKKALGLFLILLPFIGLFIAIARIESTWTALLIFGSAIGTVVIVIIGCTLLFR